MANRSKVYIDRLFSDKKIFEEEVLQVKCDEDRREVMSLVCEEICNDNKLAASINFLKIKSIDDLDFSGVHIALVQVLVGELLSLLKEKRFTHVEVENVRKDKACLKFIYELAQSYMQRFSSVLFKEVVNTFFDLISIAGKAEKLSPVVIEVINGSKKRPSLLELHGHGKVLHKKEQAWMRVKQAKDDKNRQVQTHQIETVRLVRRIDQLKLHISAIVAARALSMSEMKKITPKLLLDMFTDEDNIQLHTKKTMFSYIVGADMYQILIEMAKKAASQSKTSAEKEDYKHIADFFNKCKSVNTKSFIDTRFDEYKHELELKSKRYRQERLKMKSIRERPLDSFDVTLKKVKEAMVYNLQNL